MKALVRSVAVWMVVAVMLLAASAARAQTSPVTCPGREVTASNFQTYTVEYSCSSSQAPVGSTYCQCPTVYLATGDQFTPQCLSTGVCQSELLSSQTLCSEGLCSPDYLIINPTMAQYETGYPPAAAVSVVLSGPSGQVRSMPAGGADQLMPLQWNNATDVGTWYATVMNSNGQPVSQVVRLEVAQKPGVVPALPRLALGGCASLLLVLGMVFIGKKRA